MLEIISTLCIFFGALFILIASLGLLKLEDLYMKMHAATKSGTLGCGLVLFGVGLKLANVKSFTEIILLIIFIAMTNPISAHLIGRLHYLKCSKSNS